MREILGCWGGVGVLEGGCARPEAAGFVVSAFWLPGLTAPKWEGKFAMAVTNGLDDHQDSAQNGSHVVESKERSAKEIEVLKLMRARSMDVKKASKMFAQHQKWRREYFPLGHAQEDEIKDEIAANKFFIQGHDRTGRPLSFWYGARHFGGGNLEQYKSKLNSFVSTAEIYCVSFYFLQSPSFTSADEIASVACSFPTNRFSATLLGLDIFLGYWCAEFWNSTELTDLCHFTVLLIKFHVSKQVAGGITYCLDKLISR